MSDYVIAKYIRLSLDDTKTDSASIENQRTMLDRHIDGMDLSGATVLEFVDNGYTGTNFERPAVQELLELVREGSVGCIIVKDFSRFGRNVIETGYFLERVFPLYRIRFVSVCDAFDSDEYVGDTGGMDVTLKLLMHECYSRDLSRKIRSSKHEKMRRGELVSGNCPYGYMLDKDRKMAIDGDRAETVKIIFGMYCGGYGLTEIAKWLYEERKPSPAGRKKYADTKAGPDGADCIWGTSVISNILRDEWYTGTYIAGKTVSVEIGVQTRRDRSEWIRIPDHHPAIIKQHVFEAVSLRLAERKPSERKRRTSTSERYGGAGSSPLKGKVSCACCGHSMHLSQTKNSAFICSFSKPAAEFPCHGLRAAKDELEAEIFEIVCGCARILLESCESSVMNDMGVEYGTENMAAACQDKEMILYERFVLGELGKDEYLSEKSKISTALGRLARIDLSIGAVGGNNKSLRDLRKLAKEVTDAGSLTYEISDELIEKVLVHPDRRTEIVWKVMGFAETMLTNGGTRNVG